MDDIRFDTLSRALGAAASRRAGLRAMLGAALASPVAGVADARHGRKRRRGVAGPCGDGTAKDNRCAKDAECCTKYCADGMCRCKPNLLDCNKDDQCCSGRCISGFCDGGCKPEGSKCVDTANCCSGMICDGGLCVSSSKAKCTRATCPDGCCDGTTCRLGQTRQGCGTKGAACVTCGAGQSCQSGVCVSPPPPSTCTRTVAPAPGPGVTDTTLAAAIAAAPAGSTICVKAGTYSNSTPADSAYANPANYLGFIDKSLTIRGEGKDVTILDGLGVRSGLFIGNATYDAAISVAISGITVRNGLTYADSASCICANGNDAMSLTLTDVNVEDCWGTVAVNIGSQTGTSPTTIAFTRLTIDGTTDSCLLAGALAVEANGTMTDCRIINNTYASYCNDFTGGMHLWYGSVTMNGGEISGNTTTGAGGGFSTRGSLTLNGVSVKNNTGATGGAGYIYAGGSLTTSGVTATGNTATTCNCVYSANTPGCESVICT
jgi:hypothetical protein